MPNFTFFEFLKRMFSILKKKINYIVIVLILYVSITNLNKFNDFNVNVNDEGEEYLPYLFNENQISETPNETSEFSEDEDKRLELVKKKENLKEELDNEDLNVAYYKDDKIKSDYVFDEKDLNLNLVPIYETMLFSGIPTPESKPIPAEPEYSKSITLSLKNKKMLVKNLENYLDKSEAIFVFERLNNFLNYNVKENIKFLTDNNDQIVEIQVFAKNFQQLNLRRNFNDDFVFYFVKAPTQTKVVRNRLKVRNSLSHTLKSAKVPKGIIREFLDQLSYTIDFQRDVKNGDILEILYEANFTKNNNIIGKPILLYGLMHLNYHKIELFRYRLSNGKIDYFDANGKSIRKYLMRTPVQGARLSSKFGVRKHPILGYSKMHRGVDFAAKRGTPVMAAGDGRVTFAGRNGSFGRFIEIKHLNNFKTRYAHLYKFSKNLKKGKLVKQGDIIGYVGTSGRSTGPHLHYEVKHKNRTINPMKLKLESSLNVEDDEMANFYANISLARERFLATKLQETVTADYFYD